ncbi:MAG: 4Fe-4S binding protein [Christensenellales bacterium]
MKNTEIFGFLQEQIHTVIIATNNGQGLPVTCAVDITDYDEKGLYFLTAKGKNFYKRLKANGYLSLTGIKGNDTLSRIAVSVCGKVKEIGSERLQGLLDKNPYMYEIYPTEQSRSALTVFCLYEGQGEWFDLSKKPIERLSFSFGGKVAETVGYFITDDCTGCGKCLSVCPQSCIVLDGEKAFIRQENCLHCGNCKNICTMEAVVLK